MIFIDTHGLRLALTGLVVGYKIRNEDVFRAFISVIGI